MNRIAFDNLLTERLDASLVDTPSDRCARCGRPETPGGVLLPYGVSTQAWLHQHCRDPWAEGRRKAAIETLAIMGIVEPAP